MVDFQKELEVLEKYLFEYLLKHPFNLFSTFSCLIPFILLLFYLKSIWKNNKILVIYVFLILILELLGGYYSAHSWNNHLFYLIFYFLESICLFLYFRKSIHNNSINNINFIILNIVLLALFYNSINSNNQINDYSVSIQSLGFISISIICFYYILAKSNIKVLTNSALFWINTGSLIYFSGMLFVFLYITRILAENEKNINSYINIYAVLLIIFRLFISIGIIKIKKSN